MSLLSVEAIAERYAGSLQAVSEIADAYLFQGQLDRAWHLYQGGEQWLSAREMTSAARSSFLLKYARFLIHYYYLTNHAEDLLHSVLERAQQAADANKDQAEIALGHYLTGQALYFHNLLAGGDDYSRARDFLMKASTQQENIGDWYRLAESLFYTGLTYDREGPDERAKECYLRALSLAEQYGNNWAVSEAMRHLTDYTEGEPRLQYARRSLALREEMGLRVYIPSAQLLLSNIFNSYGNLEQASAYCQQAEQLCREMNLLPGLMRTLLMQGELAYTQENYILAHERATQAALLAHQLNIAYGIADAHRQLERLEHKQKN